jgi:hypothetical protein
MDINMNNSSIYNVINKLYEKAGFLEKYGGSLWATVIISLLFFLAISYYYIYNNIEPIKADWINQRCKPNVMPFAGLINPPDPTKMSAFEFTQNNFTNCVQSILSDIIGIFLAPFYYLIDALTKIFELISESVQAIRTLLDSIRNAFIGMTTEIMGRILNFLIPLQFLLIKVRDMMGKTQGVMAASIFTLMGTYDTIMSAVKSIVQIIVAILLSLSVIIIVLFIIPFGLGMPVAIPLLVIFILILIPGIMVYIIQVLILKQMTNPLPNIPRCFCGNTLLKLNTNQYIKIKDIVPGMILEDNNTVTATFKLAIINEEFYNLNGVICTGEHKVKYNDVWINLKNHKDSKKIDYTSDYIYCINTSKKEIQINNEIYGDWDELDTTELNELKETCKKYLPNEFEFEFELSHIHKYLDGGFSENTEIELQNGETVAIKNVKVNDKLRFGERVVGIVKIKADDLEIKKYYLKNKSCIVGGPNIQICDSDLGMMNTLDMSGEKITAKYIHHLITDNYTFYMNGIKYYDYNGCIDKFLYLENIRLINTLI